MKAKKSFFLRVLALITAITLMFTGVVDYSFALTAQDGYLLLDDGDVTFYAVIKDKDGNEVEVGAGKNPEGKQIKADEVQFVTMKFTWGGEGFPSSDQAAALKANDGLMKYYIGNDDTIIGCDLVDTSPYYVEENGVKVKYWVDVDDNGDCYVCVQILNYDESLSNYNGFYEFAGKYDYDEVADNDGLLKIGDGIEYQLDYTSNVELYANKKAVGSVAYDETNGWYYQEFEIEVISVNGVVNDVAITEKLGSYFDGIYDLYVDGTLKDSSFRGGNDLTIELDMSTPGGATSQWEWEDSKKIKVTYKARLKEPVNKKALAEYDWSDDGKNTASASGTHKDKTIDSEDSEAWMSVTKPTISKSGTLDEGSKTITWTITVKPSEVFGDSFTLSDVFAAGADKLDLSDFKALFGEEDPIKSEKLQELAEKGDPHVTYDKDTGEYTITFTTLVTADDLTSLTGDNKITNTATAKFPDITVGTSEDVDYTAEPPKGEIEKELLDYELYDPEGDYKPGEYTSRFKWQLKYTFPDDSSVSGDTIIYDDLDVRNANFDQIINDSKFLLSSFKVVDENKKPVSFDVEYQYEGYLYAVKIIIHNSENYRGKAITITYTSDVYADDLVWYIKNTAKDNNVSATVEKTFPVYTTHKYVDLGDANQKKEGIANWEIHVKASNAEEVFQKGDVITITDTLPAGLEIVEGSVKAGWVYSDSYSGGSFVDFAVGDWRGSYPDWTGVAISKSKTVTGDTEYTFKFTLPAGTSTLYEWVGLRFQTKLAEGYYTQVARSDPPMSFTNYANSTVKRSDDEFKTTVDEETFTPELNAAGTLLSKGTTYTQNDVNENNGGDVPYTITVNSEQKQLTESGKGTITLTDTMGSKLTLIEDSIEITENGTVYSGDDAKAFWKYGEDKQTLIFTLKDKTAYTIKYSVSVDYPGLSDSWDPADYTNTVDLFAFTSAADSSWVTNVRKGGAGAEGGTTTPAPITANIPVTKVISGRDWKNGESFTFTISTTDENVTLPDPKSITIFDSDADHTKSFENIEFAAVGTYTFKIKEQGSSHDGLTYDTTDHTVVIEVDTNTDGSLYIKSYTVDGISSTDGKVTITNNYSAEGELKIEVAKDIVGRPWAAGDSFTFQLTVDGNDTYTKNAIENGKIEMPSNDKTGPWTVTVSGSNTDHKALFGAIRFTDVTEAGKSYTFKLSEVNSNLPSDIVYDTTVHTISVTVTDDGNGKLVVTSSNSTITGSNGVYKAEAGFTNTVKTTAQIPVSKVISGRAWKDTDSFTFKLELVGSLNVDQNAKGVEYPATITVSSSNGSGNIRNVMSGNITFYSTGTYQFKLTETNGTAQDLIYDKTEHIVEIVVGVNSNGQLEITSIKETNGINKDLKNGGNVEFTNTYNPGKATLELDFTKNVVGRAWAVGEEFTFEITPDSATAQAITNDAITMPAKDSNGKWTVTLKKTADGIDPTGTFGIQFNAVSNGAYKFTVTEVKDGKSSDLIYDAKTYTISVTVTDDGSGKLAAAVTGVDKKSDGVYSVAFTNTAKASVNIPVTKVISGRDWKSGDSFTFTLSLVSPASSASVELPTPSTITISSKDTIEYFKNIKFSAAGVYTFDITETNGGRTIDGLKYDTKHTVIVTVVSDVNGLKIDSVKEGDTVLKSENATAASSVVFTNKYSAEGELTLNISKSVTGRAWDSADEKFVFEITPDSATKAAIEGGKITMPTSSDSGKWTVEVNGSNHKAVFGAIKFTAAGSYQFKVVEVKSGAASDIVYDTTEYVVSVEVTDPDHNGKLAVKATRNGTNITQGADGKYSITLSFNNTVQTTGEITVTKTISGRKWQQGDSFTFTITAQSSQNVSIPNPNTITIEYKDGLDTYTLSDAFKNIVFYSIGDYVFTITETVGTDTEMQYDETVYTVTVTVGLDDKGQLKITSTDIKSNVEGEEEQTKNSVEFTNTYTPYTAEGELTLNISKSVIGRPWANGETFVFEITPDNDITKEAIENGIITPALDSTGKWTVSITGNGTAASLSAAFEAIKFTAVTEADKPYQFKVVEKKAGALSDIVYDTKEYTISVAATDPNHDGKLTLAVSDAANGISGNKVADGRYSADLSFTNTVETSGEIPVTKVIDGREWQQNDSFTFNLSLVKTEDVDTAAKAVEYPESITLNYNGDSNTNTLSDAFNGIKFYSTGIYTFKIAEARGSITGITYDTTEHTVIVTVGVNAAGELEITSIREGNKDLTNGNGSVEFTNTYTAPQPDKVTTNIPVTKKIDGRNWLTSDSFTFNLKLVDSPVGSSVDIPDSTVTITGSDTFKTNYFENIVFHSTGTYTFEITETVESIAGITYDQTVHTVIVTVKETDGNLEIESTTVDGAAITTEGVVFTNKYTAEGELMLNVSKSVSGRTWADGETFVFEITPDSNTKAAIEGGKISAPQLDSSGKWTVSIVGKGTDTALSEALDTITFTEVGSYQFTVAEVQSGASSDIVYDTTVYTVSVTVTDPDHNGKLAVNATCSGTDITQGADGKYSVTLSFNNTVQLPAEIPVTKTISGRKWQQGDSFTFTITAQSSQNVTINNSTLTIEYTDGLDAYTVSDAFKDIVFYSTGDYVFTITENSGNITGMQYDETVYTVTVTVGENADGQLAITSINIKSDVEGEEQTEDSVVFINTYDQSEPELTIEKTQSVSDGAQKTTEKQTVNAGDTVTYYITVTNSGDAAANDIVVKDVIPSGLTLVEGSINNGGILLDDGKTIQWTIGTIGAGADAVLSFKVTVPEVEEATTWENVATLIYNDKPEDSNKVEIEEEEPEQPETPEPELTIKKTQSVSGGAQNTTEKQTVNAGDTVTYYITVKNTGDGAANDVVVKDVIPSGLTLVDGSINNGGILLDDGKTIQWTIGTIGAGADATLSFKVTVPKVEEATTWKNVATLIFDDEPEDSNEVEIEEKPVPKTTTTTTSTTPATEPEPETTTDDEEYFEVEDDFPQGDITIPTDDEDYFNLDDDGLPKGDMNIPTDDEDYFNLDDDGLPRGDHNLPTGVVLGGSVGLTISSLIVAAVAQTIGKRRRGRKDK